MGVSTAMRRASSRRRSADETLVHAKRMAPTAGISGVEELSPQNEFGVSVFAAMRPRSLSDGLTFGKGRTPVDAEVGALMEGLEFYFAEPGVSDVKTLWATARELAGQQAAEEALNQYIPLRGKTLEVEAPLLLARAHDLETGEESLVPAELVFRPAPDTVQKLYGTSTNGLASGNSIEEASRFALFELIERDIWSLELARSQSRLVTPESLPEEIQEIIARADQQGLSLCIRTVPNDYGLPFFVSFLTDANDLRLDSFNGGWGCAFNASDAVMQSVLEAVQSRLGLIYGGRKQTDRLARKLADGNTRKIADLVSGQIRKVLDATLSTSFTDLADVSSLTASETQLDSLIGIFREASDAPIHRVIYSPRKSPLHFVRLIIPTLEHYKVGKPRVGSRLRAALRESAAGKSVRSDGQNS
jgi:ribosomal protein S12 methylthiotransferase accessory factor